MFAVTPDFNSYTGRRRLIEAAWDAMVDLDSDDISLKELAKRTGMSPPGIYKHFPDKASIFLFVAGAGLATLLVNLEGGSEPSIEDFVHSWIRFAHARPRHYALMFSVRFSEQQGIDNRRDGILKNVAELGERYLGFAPTKAQTQALFSLIHGAASMAASGMTRPPAPVIVEAVEAYLDKLKRRG